MSVQRDRPERLRRFSAIVAATAVLTGGGFALLHEPPAALQGPPLGAIRTPSPMYAPPAPIAPPALATAIAPAAPAPVTSMLRSRYERLSRGTPVERMQAYTLAERCLDVGLYPALAFEKATRCGDLTPGQLAGRVQLLEVAAEAGVHRAWYALQAEADGYFSAGMVPNTPEYQARLDRFAAIAIEHGDPRAIQTVLPQLAQSDSPEDAAKALELQVAVLVGFAQELGYQPPLALLSNPLAQRIAQKLPNDEARAQAVQAGLARASKSPKS